MPAPAPLLRFALAGTLCWAALLATGLGDRDLAGGGLPAVSVYLLQLGGHATLLGAPVLLLLHGLHRRLSGAAALALLAGLGTYPAFQQARFLTEGEHIAATQHVGLLRVLLTLGTVLAYAALWGWHLRGNGGARAPRALRRALPGWSRSSCWSLAGLTALMMLTNVLNLHLRAYAYFAQALLPATWLLSATLGQRLLRAARVPGWLAGLGLLACAVLVGTAHLQTPGALQEARHGLLRRGRIAAYADLLMSVRGAAYASFDLSRPERFDCGAATPAAVPGAPPVTVEGAPDAADPADPAAPADHTKDAALGSGGGPRNVLLISIDALRRDALDWQVPTKKGSVALMPNLRRFAEASVDYRRAVTTYPATLLSMGGAMTGMGPSDLLFAPALPDNIFRLTRHVFTQRLAFLPSSRWFRMPVIEPLLVQDAKLRRASNARKQTQMLIAALRRARRRKQATLAWVHYFEPHAPYRVHAGFERGAGSRGRYRSELSYLDDQLGRLFRFLERQKAYRDTLVILFADHGQALGEHDYRGHHVYLNSWIADVPLLVRAPGLAARTTDVMADLTDVAPTVLDFAGLPGAARGMVGHSLIAGDAAARPWVRFAEAFPLRGTELFHTTRRPIHDLAGLRKRVRRAQRGARNYLPKVAAVSGTHRLIVNRVTGVQELYDRRTDPLETRDLSRMDVAELAPLQRALGEWTRAQARRMYCAVVAPESAPTRTPRPARTPAGR